MRLSSYPYSAPKMTPRGDINRRDGRQFLVDKELPQMLRPEGDRPLWETIVLRPFENVDRIEQSVLKDLLIRMLDCSTDNKRTMVESQRVKWTRSAIQILEYLAADI